MKMRSLTVHGWKFFGVLAAVLLGAAASAAQTAGAGGSAAPPNTLEDSVRQLARQVSELRATIAEMREEEQSSRAETRALRQELEAARQQMAAAQAQAAGSAPPSAETGSAPSATDEKLAKLGEDQQLLNGKVEELHQTKIESASRYRVRLSGIVLLNLFSDSAPVDNQDIPSWANPPAPFNSGGNVGATLRQSQLGLEVFGPDLVGAKTSAGVQFDFAGGFPSAANGVTNGIVRLRTATFRMDWDNTSLIAGQDTLFFSPRSPSSIASLALPALAYAGNLWTWTPQVAVVHTLHLSDQSDFKVEGGVLDPLTGDYPGGSPLRSPGAGESSGQPAYAAHLAWDRRFFGQTLSFGAGGYYSRQNWEFGRNVDGWAATADWLIPLGSRFELSGEFYRGRSVAGLGGGIGQSVVWSGDATNPATIVQGLDSMGGWTQLKFRATERLEFNVAYGIDNPFNGELAKFPGEQQFFGPSLARNLSYFTNFIYRPRSDLLFSLEYRRLQTTYIPADRYGVNLFNLSMGVLF
jgi:hypothetical protein